MTDPARTWNAVGPCGDFVDGFAAGAAVGEQLPVRGRGADLGW